MPKVFGLHEIELQPDIDPAEYKRLPGRRRATAYEGSGTVHVGAPVGRCGVTHFATRASVITDCRPTRYESQAEVWICPSTPLPARLRPRWSGLAPA
jgi:hypothetical protein